MNTISESLNKLHNDIAICDCCGYHLTKKEIESGTIYCFDCVNEEPQESFNSIEYHVNNEEEE